MTLGTKLQPYPYTLRMVNLYREYVPCSYRYFFYITPPRNALTIENLYTRIRLTFSAAVATANQKIVSVGIADQVPTSVTGTPNYEKLFTLNQAADANRVIDLRLDLSVLLNRNNVGYRESGGTYPSTGYTYVELNLSSNVNNGATGQVTINLWKIDALFTTTGIR